MNRRWSPLSDRGFTLVEVMIAMVILGLVLTGVVKMFTSTGRFYTSQEMMVSLTQDMRAVRTLMSQEIREAGCNPKHLIRIGFQTSNDDRYNTDADSIHFTRDIDNGDGDDNLEPDGYPNDPNENIRYYRTNDNCNGTVGAILAAGNNTPGCLRRQTGTTSGGGGQPVMADVTDLHFIYYDANGNVLPPAGLSTNTALDKIRTVEVIITGRVANPGRTIETSQTQQFRLKIRNMGI